MNFIFCIAQNINERRWGKLITCYEEAEIRDEDPKIFCAQTTRGIINHSINFNPLNKNK